MRNGKLFIGVLGYSMFYCMKTSDSKHSAWKLVTENTSPVKIDQNKKLTNEERKRLKERHSQSDYSEKKQCNINNVLLCVKSKRNI